MSIPLAYYFLIKLQMFPANDQSDSGATDF